jgi:hypothetical protein
VASTRKLLVMMSAGATCGRGRRPWRGRGRSKGFMVFMGTVAGLMHDFIAELRPTVESVTFW